MKRTFVAILLTSFVATGSTAVLAKDMNAENRARVMVKEVAKHQKAEAEEQKAQQADSAGTAGANKNSVRAR